MLWDAVMRGNWIVKWVTFIWLVRNNVETLFLTPNESDNKESQRSRRGNTLSASNTSVGIRVPEEQDKKWWYSGEVSTWSSSIIHQVEGPSWWGASARQFYQVVLAQWLAGLLASEWVLGSNLGKGENLINFWQKRIFT